MKKISKLLVFGNLMFSFCCEVFADSDISNEIENIATNPKTGLAFIYVTIFCLFFSIVSFVKLFNYVKEQNEI